MADEWDAILKSMDEDGLPDEARQEIAKNYFNQEFMANGLGKEPPEIQEEVRRNFFATIQPARIKNTSQTTTPILDEIPKGLAAGVEQVKGMGYGLSALAGQTIGNQDLIEYGRKGLAEVEAATPKPSVGSYKDIKSLDDAASYLAYGIATNIPNMLISLGTGGVGWGVGKAVAGNAIKAAVKSSLEKGLSQEAAVLAGKEAAKKFVERGAIAGAASASIGMEAGSIAGDQLTETGKVDPLRAVAGAIPAGLLDVVPEWYLVKRLGVIGDAKGFTGLRIKEIAKSFGKQFALEAPTEAMQSVIERASVPGKSISNQEAWDEYINSFILGGATGGIFGGVGGVFNKRAPSQIKVTPDGDSANLLSSTTPVPEPEVVVDKPLFESEGDIASKEEIEKILRGEKFDLLGEKPPEATQPTPEPQTTPTPQAEAEKGVDLGAAPTDILADRPSGETVTGPPETLATPAEQPWNMTVEELRQRVGGAEGRTGADAEVQSVIDFVRNLPDKITVYRSVGKEEGAGKTPLGQNWTIDGSSAAEIAKHNKGERIFVGEINKSDLDLNYTAETIHRDLDNGIKELNITPDKVKNVRNISIDEAISTKQPAGTGVQYGEGFYDAKFGDMRIGKDINPKKVVSESENQFGLKEVLSREKNLDIINLVDTEGKNVGGISQRKYPSGEIKIGEIYLEPEYRGKGIAQYLYGKFPDAAPGEARTEAAIKAREKYESTKQETVRPETKVAGGKYVEPESIYQEIRENEGIEAEKLARGLNRNDVITIDTHVRGDNIIMQIFAEQVILDKITSTGINVTRINPTKGIDESYQIRVPKSEVNRILRDIEQQPNVGQPEANPELLKELPTGEQYLSSKGYKIPKFKFSPANADKWFKVLYEKNPGLDTKKYQAVLTEWQDLADRSVYEGKNLFTEKPPEKTQTMQEKVEKVVNLKDRRDLIPGWKIEYNKKSEESVKVDKEEKTITFAKKKDFENTAEINNAVASVVVKQLPESVTDEYAKLKNYEDEVVVEKGQHIFDMEVEYGAYLNGILEDETVKSFFEKSVNKELDGIVKENETKYEIVKSIEKQADKFGSKVITVSKKTEAAGSMNRITRIMQEFLREKVIGLTGLQLNSIPEIASMAQIYRDERVETFRYLFMKDGMVVDEVGLSSRLPGTSNISKDNNTSKIAAKMYSQAKRLGANSIVLIHNHPSGVPEPSPADIKVTSELASRINKHGDVKFGGHVIINSTKYSVIAKDGTHEIVDLPKQVVDKFGTRSEISIQIKAKGDIAAIASSLKRQENYVTVLYCSSQGYVNNVQDVPVNLVKSSGINGFLRGQARKYGGAKIFFYLDDINAIGTDVAEKLIEAGSVRDVVHSEDGKSVLGDSPISGYISSRRNMAFGKKATEYSVTRVMENEVSTEEETKKAPTFEDIKREKYNTADRNVVELPEIIELILSVTGKTPRIRKNLGKMLGAFRDDIGVIDVIHTLTPEQMAEVLGHNIGHISEWIEGKTMKAGNIFAKIASINGYFKSLLEEYPGSPDKVLTKEDRERLHSEAQKEGKKAGESLFKYVTRMEPVYADTDITPTMILDLLRGLTNSPKEVLDYLKSVDGPEKAKIVREAFKGVVSERIAELKARKVIGERPVTTVEEIKLGDLNKRISKLFNDKLNEEIDKRKLFRKEQIEAELKELSRLWNNFEPRENDPYTTKRFLPSELYADAVSVLINDPAMLKKEAPEFYKAFFNYMERRPTFKAKYDEIQARLNDKDAVMKNRSEFTRKMSEHGEQRKAYEDQLKEVKKRITWKGILHDIRKHIDTENIRYIEKVQEWLKQDKIVPDNMRIDYWMNELPRISSEVFAYMHESMAMIDAMIKEKFSIDDLHEYLTLERSAFERKDLAAPGGIGGELAERQLEWINEKLGKERAKKLKDYADKFRLIYRKNVVDVVVKSKFLDKNLEEYMLNNQFYVTFDYIKEEMDKRYGSAGSAAILNQYGGLGEIKNVVTSTLLKGASLIRAARYHDTKMAILQSLIEMSDNPELEVIQAERVGKFDFNRPPEGYGLIVVSPNGKRQGYFIEKELSDAWNKDPDRAGALFRIGIATKQIITKLFIGWNIPWIVGNPVRDMLGTYKKMPNSSGYVLKAYKNTFMEAVHAVFSGKTSDRELRLLRSHALNPGRFFEIDEALKRETDKLSNLGKTISAAENAGARRNQREFYEKGKKAYEWIMNQENNKFLLLPPVLRFLDKVGMVGERWGKFAGDEIIQMQKKDGIYSGGPHKEIYDVANRAGTPNFQQEGLWTKWAEIIFPFSRVAIQDIVSGVGSYKENRSSYILKTTLINVMPKIVLALMAAGLMGDELKKLSRQITTYYRRLYTCVPLYEIDGQTVFLKIPQDYTGQSIGAIVDSIISGEFTGTAGVLGSVSGYQPFNANPFLSAAYDWGAYYTSKVVPTNFYGQKVLNPEEAKAGGVPAAKGLARMTWNEFFGGLIYKIPTGGAERIEPELKKVLKVTPFSALGKFIGVSDTGAEEEGRRWMEKERSEKAIKNIDVNKLATDIINEYPEDVAREKLYELRYELVDQGKIDPKLQSAKEFVKNYMQIEHQTTGSPQMRQFSRGQTSEERAILIRNYADIYGEDRKEKLIEELNENGLMTKGVRRALNRMEDINNTD